MILVDTSVWIDHLHAADPRLVRCLEQGEVCIHPMVIGELALGSLRDRRTIIDSLSDLPSSSVATHTEVLQFIKALDLAGAGIGLVDVHLLAAARLDEAILWTRDRQLLIAAQRVEVATNR